MAIIQCGKAIKGKTPKGGEAVEPHHKKYLRIAGGKQQRAQGVESSDPNLIEHPRDLTAQA